MNIISQIEAGDIYLLDGRTPVIILKPLNRSKTVFSIQTPDKSVETVSIERLRSQTTNDSSQEDILNFETEVHSMPDIIND